MYVCIKMRHSFLKLFVAKIQHHSMEHLYQGFASDENPFNR